MSVHQIKPRPATGDDQTSLIEALRAASDRIMAQRKALHRAQVLLRVYPQGLVFSCILSNRDEFDHVTLHGAGGYEEVTWEKLEKFDAAAARAVVDRVCAKAHKLYGTAVPE